MRSSDSRDNSPQQLVANLVLEPVPAECLCRSRSSLPGSLSPCLFAPFLHAVVLTCYIMKKKCDIWGQCGTTADFCTATRSTTGAAGTAAAGSNGCISNCGNGIVNNANPPAQFFKIGYFEGFNQQRPCLTMSADQIPSGYTHVHFAFGGITSGFQVDLSGIQDQFELFARQTSFKRILSFGGWSFSTDADTYPVFQNGVTAANRLAFAKSVVSVVEQYGLDGVDFDWEYPGATDIPGVPPGSPDDGANYLTFLQTLRSVLPSGKTISIAAPASYWYLRHFPIASVAQVLDYIIFMT